MPLYTYPVVEGRPQTGATIPYTIPGVDTFSASTLTPPPNVMRYFPIFTPTPITLDQLAIEITSQAVSGGVARLGIYNADTNYQPTSLIIDAGTVAIDSLGVKTVSINVTLAPGRYLLAQNNNGSGAPTFRSRVGGVRYAGYPAALGAAFTGTLTKSLTFASFTNPGVAWDTTATSSGFIYIVFCRVSVP